MTFDISKFCVFCGLTLIGTKSTGKDRIKVCLPIFRWYIANTGDIITNFMAPSLS